MLGSFVVIIRQTASMTQHVVYTSLHLSIHPGLIETQCFLADCVGFCILLILLIGITQSIQNVGYVFLSSIMSAKTQCLFIMLHTGRDQTASATGQRQVMANFDTHARKMHPAVV